MADIDALSTHSLLLRLQHLSDEEAWVEFVNRYGEPIRRYAQRYARNDADAQDMAQKILVKLVRLFSKRPLDQFYDRQRGPFRAWFSGLMKHQILDYLRAQQRELPGTRDSRIVELLENAAAREDLERQYLTILVRDGVAAVLATWRGQGRNADADLMELYKLNERPAEEVGKRLGISAVNVRVRWSRLAFEIKKTFPELAELVDRVAESGHETQPAEETRG